MKEINNYPSEHTSAKKARQPIADVEKVLGVWVEAQTSHHVPLAKASSRARPELACSVKAERGGMQKRSLQPAEARSLRLKERSRLHNVSVRSKAPGYPGQVREFLTAAALNNRSAVQADSPASEQGAIRDLHSRGGESVPGFRASEDRPTLPLGAHAAGDVELKPVLTGCSESPRPSGIISPDSACAL